MRKQTAKKLIILLFGLVSLGLFWSATKLAYATGPNLISFQGKVVNADGTNVTNGAYNFDFVLYDDPSLGSPSDGVHDKWHELTKSVTVTNGVFQTELGSATTLPDFNANPALYLAIRFNADAAGYMSPRIHMDSVPYARNADTVGGVAAASLVQLGATQSGNINIGTGSVTAGSIDSNAAAAALGVGTTNAGAITIGNVTNSTVLFKTKALATAFQIQNASSNELLTVDTSGNKVVLGKIGSSGINGALVFNTTNAANTTISITAASTGTSYSLTLPTAGPSTSQCLQTDSVTASQLTFGACSAGGGVTTVGAFSASSQTNGANITGSTITFGPADATNPGMVSTGAQTLAGSKTFTGAALFQNSTNSTTAFQVQNQSGINLAQVDTTTDSANLITNGSFGVNTTGWAAEGASTISRTTSSPTPYLGLGQLKVVTTAAANDGTKYAFALASATQYSLTAFASLDSGSAAMATFEMGRADNGSTDTSCLTAQTLVTTGWTRFTCTFTTGTTSGSPYVYFKQTNAAIHTYYLDAVKLEAAATATPYKEGTQYLNGNIGSPTTFKNQSDSTAALQIQNAAGTSNLLVADTLNSRIGIGVAAPSYTLDFRHTETATSGFLSMAYLEGTVNPGSASSTDYITAWNRAFTANSAINYTGSLTGIYQETIHQGTGTLANAYGSQNNVKLTNTGTITTAYGLISNLQVTAAGTVTTRYGAAISNPTLSGGGAVTNNYGLYVFNQTSGGTSNYGLYIQGASTNAIYVNSGDSFFGGRGNFKNSANSTTAFQVQNLGGANELNIDTTGTNQNNVIQSANPNGSFENNSTTGWAADAVIAGCTLSAVTSATNSTLQWFI